MSVPLDEARGVLLALDGFNFEDDHIDASVLNALMTPLHGVVSVEDIIYHNLVGLTTSALLFREADRLNVWETHLNRNDQLANDAPPVAQAIRDIYKLVKLPKFIPEISGVIETRSTLPDLYCKNFLSSILEDEASPNILQDKDNQYEVAPILHNILSPAGQVMIEEMIKEAQSSGQVSSSIRSSRDNLLDEFRNAIHGIHQQEQKAKHIASELAIWKPRLQGFTHDVWASYHATDQVKALPVEEQAQIPLLVEKNTVKVDDGTIASTSSKRKHKNNSGRKPKRICTNTDEVDGATTLPSRYCTIM
ncbi:hypothetical protein ABKA04_008195 [Annulohypoxylon sp. FPYF3050]